MSLYALELCFATPPFVKYRRKRWVATHPQSLFDLPVLGALPQNSTATIRLKQSTSTHPPRNEYSYPWSALALSATGSYTQIPPPAMSNKSRLSYQALINQHHTGGKFHVPSTGPLPDPSGRARVWHCLPVQRSMSRVPLVALCGRRVTCQSKATTSALTRRDVGYQWR